MKKKAMALMLILVFLLALLVFSGASASKPQSTNDWIWSVTNTVSQINGGCCEDQIVVVEGTIGNVTDPSWNYYNFSDGTGTITLDFEDEIPTVAIIQGTTVRIIGKAEENNGGLKIDVYGEQTLGTVSATANATVAQVESDNLKDQEVAVLGKYGDKLDNPGYWGVGLR